MRERIMLARLIVIVTAMLLADASEAQTINGALRGLTRVIINIDDLSPNATECGFTRERIREAIMFSLSSTKIDVVDLAVNTPFLYVLISSLRFQSPLPFCVSSLEVQVYAFGDVTLGFSNEKKRAKIELWHDGIIFSSYQSDHTQQMSETLEGRMKKFITDWNLDNKSSRK